MAPGGTHGTGEAVDLSAGDGGTRYLSVHRRRGPLQIAPLTGG